MRKIFLFIGVVAVFLFGYYQEANCQVNSREDLVQVTIEPVNCCTTEAGVYIFDKAEPLKIKVTLRNISNSKLILLDPGKQNSYRKVFYFQILDKDGNIIHVDRRRIWMERDEFKGPERIELMPGATHEFYAYLNSNKDNIEHAHFTDPAWVSAISKRFKDLLRRRLNDEYYQIQGIYDTTEYGQKEISDWLHSSFSLDRIFYFSSNDYKDVDKVTIFSNMIKLKATESQPLESGKEAYEIGHYIDFYLDLEKIDDQKVIFRILNGDGYFQIENGNNVMGKMLLFRIPPLRKSMITDLGKPVIILTIPTLVANGRFSSDSSLKRIVVGKYILKLVSGNWVSNSIEIEVTDNKNIKEKLHVIKVKREIKTGTDKRMIEIAENTYPPKNEVSEAIKKAQFKLKSVPDTEKLWWYSEFDDVLIPYAITAEAIAYYINLIEEYRRNIDNMNSDIIPSSAFKYFASVDFKDKYEREGKVFNSVYVVAMKLEMGAHWASLAALFFEKDRIVIIDSQGNVLAIFGDGNTAFGVS